MPFRFGRSLLAALIITGVSAPALAQQHSVTLNLGYFAVRGEDARIDDDVLVENLRVFGFDLRDFNNANVGGEWLVGLGDYLEAGFGLGFYRRTVPSVYDDYIDEDGTEIAQDFKLRVIPLSATIRFLPFGRRRVEPYVGLGAGLFAWRYSEVGEFVDFTDFSIFRDRYVATGNDVGPIVLGGIRVPVGSRYSVGGEVRYQQARGTVGVDNGFLDERIDLGGLTTLFTFQVKF